ncbi:MAG: GNAT family N-acetyltransferase [Polyangiaceae bacterium]|nr:GNAT family N-acetyltransferase [Polyangiaceae bacterium]
MSWVSVVLRPVVESDLDELFEQQRDPESVQMALVSPREREEFFAHWKKIMADRQVTLRVIAVDGDVAGHVVGWLADDNWTVGYWLGRAFWGKGIATKALEQLLELLQVRPLWARVAKHNAASLRVLQKCGFTMHHEEEFTLRTGEVGHGYVLTLTG